MKCAQRKRATLLLAGALTAIVINASAQVGPSSRSIELQTCGREAVGLGRIAGKLVADSAGIDIKRQRVLAINGCSVVSDSSGAFVIRGLPAGTYGVLVSPGRDHATLPAAPIRVAADSTSTITLRLKPVDRVSDCRRFPECAAILEMPPPSLRAILSDSEQVLEAGFRTDIAMSALPRIAVGLPQSPGYHLEIRRVTPPGDAVVKAVRARVPTAEATHPRNTIGPSGLTPDIERFPVVYVNSVKIDGDHATVQGAEFESLWFVTLDRTPSGWRPVAFVVTGAH